MNEPSFTPDQMKALDRLLATVDEAGWSSWIRSAIASAYVAGLKAGDAPHRSLRYLEPMYSGDASKPFWDRVNALKRDDDAGHERWAHVYELGCILQEMEGRVFRALDQVDPPGKKIEDAEKPR